MLASPAHPFSVEVLVATAANAGRLLIAWAESPPVVIQAAAIVITGIIAYWVAARFRGPLEWAAREAMPRAWAQGVALALNSVAAPLAPLAWLVALGLWVVAAQTAGLPVGLVSAAASLLAAWIVIRLLSTLALHPVWSGLIAVVAWSIAALAILGLLHPLARQLSAIALDFGRLHLSVLSVLRATLVLVILLWLSNRFGAFLERRITRTQNLTPSLQVLLVHLLRLLLPTLAVVVALGAVGIDLTALAVFSGAIGIGIGLGLQQLAANVIAGFVLILDKSIKPGDVISIGETFGRVTSLGARYVSMRTRDGIEYLIPNNHFMNSGVENWSYSDVNVRLKVQVGVAYETDLHQAIALSIEAAKAVPRVLEQPRPICLVAGFGESAITLEIRLWINDPSDGVANVRSAVWLEVWDRVKQAGIRIPFPQRDVHIIR